MINNLNTLTTLFDSDVIEQNDALFSDYAAALSQPKNIASLITEANYKKDGITYKLVTVDKQRKPKKYSLKLFITDDPDNREFLPDIKELKPGDLTNKITLDLKDFLNGLKRVKNSYDVRALYNPINSKEIIEKLAYTVIDTDKNGAFKLLNLDGCSLTDFTLPDKAQTYNKDNFIKLPWGGEDVIIRTLKKAVKFNKKHALECEKITIEQYKVDGGAVSLICFGGLFILTASYNPKFTRYDHIDLEKEETAYKINLNKSELKDILKDFDKKDKDRVISHLGVEKIDGNYAVYLEYSFNNAILDYKGRRYLTGNYSVFYDAAADTDFNKHGLLFNTNYLLNVLEGVETVNGNFTLNVPKKINHPLKLESKNYNAVLLPIMNKKTA